MWPGDRLRRKKIQICSCADSMFLWRHNILVAGKLIVSPKENDVGTGAIWDFLSCHHNYKGVKPFEKGVSEGNEPKCVGSFILTHFIS